jgi:hypothetical protein
MSAAKKIAVLKFNGPRFEDHGLDVDVLPEIIAYKRLLQETAKALWKRKNPDRQRLPKNFNAEISLKFFKIEPGSAGVPLLRSATGRLAPRLPFDDELDDAAKLIESSIRMAGTSEAIPKDLPRSVIPLFQDFGRTLHADESILISAGTADSGARYDGKVKIRILSWISVPHTDCVELTGEVRGTDLDGLKFMLRLSDGRKIPGRFEADQESIVLEALGEHTSRRLRVVGQGEFSPMNGELQQITKVELVQLVEPELMVTDRAPIWERLAAIAAALPADTWIDVPTDLAENADRYLYGNKKDTH